MSIEMQAARSWLNLLAATQQYCEELSDKETNNIVEPLAAELKHEPRS